MFDAARISSSRKTPDYIALLAGSAWILLLTSCSSGGAAGAGGAPPPAGRAAGAGAAVAVVAAPVVAKPMAVNVRVVGNVEASSTVEIRAQVTGALLSVGFTEGEEVAAGQLLFTLDSRPFEVALRQVEATVASTTAQAKNVETQLARQADLLKRGLVAQSDFDTTTAQLGALRGTIAANTAAADNARLQLQYTKIVSPVAGRTGALLVHPGALVRANDAAPLVIINQMAPVFVSFALPARLLPQVRNARAGGGLPVKVSPAGATGQDESGTVSFVDNAVDPSTDTVRLKATFANRSRRLWPGAFVDVLIQLSVSENAIVIPSSAVQASQQGQFVYVVKADQTVEVRPVTIGWVEGRESVIQSGVAAGETVVIDGQLRLTPGARVSVKPASGPARSSS